MTPEQVDKLRDTLATAAQEFCDEEEVLPREFAINVTVRLDHHEPEYVVVTFDRMEHNPFGPNR